MNPQSVALYELSKKEHQGEAILKYLMAGNSITPLEALNMFGCFRLGARIWELKKKYDIKRETVSKDGKRFARYYLGGHEIQRELWR